MTVLQLDKLTDLEALAGLTEVPGSVELVELPALPSLEGLHNLERVASLRIDDCPLLADLDGLRGLQRVDADVVLEQLSLTDLHGLEGLTELGEPGGETATITMLYVPQLASLDGLAVDWHGHNAFSIHGSAITDLDPLAGVTELAGLSLSENHALVDLAGLEALVEVHGGLDLFGNMKLVDLGALANLESVGLLLLAESVVSDLALPALQEASEVWVLRNAQLTALSGLAGLSSVGTLRLEHNPALTDLSDLAALTQVEGDLEIRSNDALSSVAELALTGVGGRLVVVINPSLLQTEAVAWGAKIEVGIDRKIAGNKGDPATPADPCPWEGDGQCDEDELCAPGTDESDCPLGE